MKMTNEVNSSPTPSFGRRTESPGSTGRYCEVEESLVECMMCGCTTAAGYLRNHIRFNHLINKEFLVDKMYQLHNPSQTSVSSQTNISWVHRQTEYFTEEEGRKDPEKEEHDDVVIVGAQEEEDGEDGVDVLDGEGDDEVTCPGCGEVEDGTAMIGCKQCDRWFHRGCLVGKSSTSKGEELKCGDCRNKPGKRVQHKKVGFDDLRPDARVECSSSSNEEETEIKVTAVVKPKRSHILEKFCDSDTSTDVQNTTDKPVRRSFKRKRSKEEMRKKQFKSSRRTPCSPIPPSPSSPVPPAPSYPSDHSDIESDSVHETTSVGKKKVKTKKTRKKVREDPGKVSSKSTKSGKSKVGTEEKSHQDSDEGWDQGEDICKLQEIDSGDELCKLCGYGYDLPNELELGPLFRFGVCQAHLHCLMFSSGLIQGGDEEDGIVGFLPDDIIKEWQRGSKLKCYFCKELYATVGCCEKQCMKTYHLPCGIKNGSVNEYYGNFDSYCQNHIERRKHGKNYILTVKGLIPEKRISQGGKKNQIRNKKSSRPGSRTENIRREEKSQLERKRMEDRNENDRRKDEKKKKQTLEKSFMEPISSKRAIIKPKLFDDYDVGSTDDGSTARRSNRTSDVGSTDDGSTARRSNRPRRRIEPTSNTIYKSAKEELEKILKSKYVSIEESFENLSGRRRLRKSRGSLKKSDSSDNEKEEELPKRSRPTRRKSESVINKNFIEVDSGIKDEEDEVKEERLHEEETIENIEEFLGERRNTRSNNISDEVDPLQVFPPTPTKHVDQNIVKVETKSPRGGGGGDFTSFMQQDGSCDHIDFSRLGIDENLVEEVFPDRDFSDISGSENHDIGIEEIIETLSENKYPDPRVVKYKCSHCIFSTNSKPIMKTHLLNIHQSSNTTHQVQEMKIFTKNIRLKQEQLRSAQSTNFNEIYEKLCYIKDLERFSFVHYVSDDMSDSISDIDSNPMNSADVDRDMEELILSPNRTGTRIRTKKKEMKGFLSWDQVGKKSSSKMPIQLESEQVSAPEGSLTSSRNSSPRANVIRSSNSPFNPENHSPISIIPFHTESRESTSLRSGSRDKSTEKLLPGVNSPSCFTRSERRSGTPASKTESLAPTSDCQALKSDSPTSKTGSPASKSGSPASKSGSPASKSSSPASKSSSPASKSSSPASKSSSPASKSGSPALKLGSPASKCSSLALKSCSQTVKSGSPNDKSQEIYKCNKCTKVFTAKELLISHSSLCPCRTEDELKPISGSRSFKLLYSTVGDYSDTSREQEPLEDVKDERPYLVKFEDAQGREHTWVDEYEENGLPALYVDGKGEGQVCASELKQALALEAKIPQNLQHLILKSGN